jgi:hypothetical protein
MKKFLPIFLFISFFSASLALPQTTYGQAADPDPDTHTGTWVTDPEVTFIGKNAARSGLFFNWTLKNYSWACFKEPKTGGQACDTDANNPIAKYWWTTVTYVVSPLLMLIILTTAVIMIITRGRNLTIMRFLPRFVAVILLIVFSYSMIQFLYQFTDMLQSFFLRADVTKPCPPSCISQSDLLVFAWHYDDFIGQRLISVSDANSYAEASFISLILVKLTTMTYFVIGLMLLIRKIVLWFFLIISPIFPILLLYYPIRNTGKIWVGEFFRWLLYAPLFAIFLKGLLFMWRSSIPLVFIPLGGADAIGQPDQVLYPTSINILLGGPKQAVGPSNSVNLTETFALYVVALLMLWIVILLPWVLLQIFLDHAPQLKGSDSVFMKKLSNYATKGAPFATPGGGGGGNDAPQSHAQGISMPFKKTFLIPKPIQPTEPGGAAREISSSSNSSSNSTLTSTSTNTGTKPLSSPFYASKGHELQLSQINADVLRIANTQLPSIRDIAKYETSLMSHDKTGQQSAQGIIKNLQSIANPANITNPIEREKFQQIRDRLVREKQQGNQLAGGILNAAQTAMRSGTQQENTSLRKTSASQIKNILQQIANPALANTSNRERISALHDMLQKESKENNNQLATSILTVNADTLVIDVEKIKDQILTSRDQNNTVASSVSSLVYDQSSKDQATASTKSILQQIANPQTVIDRDTATKLHTNLVQASTGGDPLATSLLNFNQHTIKDVDVENLEAKILEAKAKGDPLATQIAQMTAPYADMPIEQRTEYAKNILQQIANPQSTVDRDMITKLHSNLVKASAGGDPLAASLLNFNQHTIKDVDFESLQEKILEAKAKGNQLATQLAQITAPEVNIPVVNRVQVVNKEDYQAVKNMWKENYKNLDVPQEMGEARRDWIKDDSVNIDEIVGMLSSTDKKKAAQGLREVSNILPFLMIGGFSQTEIISYLKAKREAAQEAITELDKEEDTKIDVKKKKEETPKKMAASMGNEDGATGDSRQKKEEAQKKDAASTENNGTAQDSREKKEEASVSPDQPEENKPLEDVLAEEESLNKETINKELS